MEKYSYKIETQKGNIVARGVLVGNEETARTLAVRMKDRLKAELDVEYMITIRKVRIQKRKRNESNTINLGFAAYR